MAAISELQPDAPSSQITGKGKCRAYIGLDMAAKWPRRGGQPSLLAVSLYSQLTHRSHAPTVRACSRPRSVSRMLESWRFAVAYVFHTFHARQ